MFLPAKFKIWYNHQISGPAYEQDVPDPVVGQMILNAIYQVALYQFRNGMIPDYCNTGGIVYLEEDGEWCDFDPEEWGDEFASPGKDPDRCGTASIHDWEQDVCRSCGISVEKYRTKLIAYHDFWRARGK